MRETNLSRPSARDLQRLRGAPRVEARDVLQDRALEHLRILGHESDRLAHPRSIERGHRHAVEQRFARGGRGEPAQQAQQRRAPAAIGALDDQEFAGLYGERHRVDQVAARFRQSVAHGAQLDAPRHRRRRIPRRVGGAPRAEARAAKQRRDLVVQSLHALVRDPQAAGALQRPERAQHEQDAGRKFAIAHLAAHHQQAAAGDHQHCHQRREQAAHARGHVERRGDAPRQVGAGLLQPLVAAQHEGFHRERLDRVHAAQRLDQEVAAPPVGVVAIAEQLAVVRAEGPAHIGEDQHADERDQHQPAADHRHQREVEQREGQVEELQHRLAAAVLLQRHDRLEALDVAAAVDFLGRRGEQAREGVVHRAVLEARRRPHHDIGAHQAQQRLGRQRHRGAQHQQRERIERTVRQDAIEHLQHEQRQREREQVDRGARRRHPGEIAAAGPPRPGQPREQRQLRDGGRVQPWHGSPLSLRLPPPSAL
jgi:hypothetical protein